MEIAKILIEKNIKFIWNFKKNIKHNILQNRLNYNKIASTVKAPNIYYSPVDILGSAAKRGDILRICINPLLWRDGQFWLGKVLFFMRLHFQIKCRPVSFLRSIFKFEINYQGPEITEFKHTINLAQLNAYYRTSSPKENVLNGSNLN